jgi:hypothetical protein
MEDILTQRFNYTKITPFRNYSRLDERNPNGTTFNSDLDDLDFGLENYKKDFISDLSINQSKMVGRIVPFLEPHSKSKVKFFYNNSNVGENIEIKYAYYDKRRNCSIFETTNDRHIKKHFGNPFSEIETRVIERSVRRHGDKLTIKVYVNSKYRRLNHIYFKKTFYVKSLTINLKTGNFTIGEISKRGKTSSKRFRINCFSHLKNFLLLSGTPFKLGNSFMETNSTLYDEYVENLNDIEFMNVVWKTLGFNIPKRECDQRLFFDEMIKFFVERKKIKVPDNYENLLIKFYPTEKYLKKNDRKLIASVLDMFNIKSKITIKLLHTVKNIDIASLVSLSILFGDDYPKYLGSIDINHFDNTLKVSPSDEQTKQLILNTVKNTTILRLPTDVEKENLIKILNSPNRGSEMTINSMNITLIIDHFNMLEKIQRYVPDIEMKAKSFDEFHKEHNEFSRIIGAMKKGWVIEYQFNEDTVKQIEKPIPLKINIGTDEEPIYAKGKDGELFTIYPKILKREEEYKEEGDFMHHCVASYSDKERSIIISFRTKDESDRGTCEFDCQTGEMIQARHFCNKEVPADIMMAIDKLKPTIVRLARFGKLHSIEKKKVPVKINGIEIIKEDRDLRRADDPIFRLAEHALPF